MKRRVSKVLVVAVAGLVLLSVGVYAYVSNSGPSPQARAARTAQAGTPVEAAAVVRRNVAVEIGAVGTLQPNESVVIQPEVAGRIARFGFEEGARVGKGDVLVQLDRDILKAEFARAQSDLRLATANYERTSTLARQGSATLRARDEARAALDAARANHDLAEARLRRADIVAPFGGVVGLRRLSVGEYVSPGTRIVELAEIDPIKVDFRVPEVHLSKIRRDQPIVVTVDARPGESFEGRLYAIDPVVDENGRAIRLRATIPNPDGKLSPGLFARVRIIVEKREGALMVPESAVFAEKDSKYVYRIVDGRAALTEVKVGLRRPGEVEILSGLDAEARVVTAGQQQVRDGAAVRVLRTAAGG